MYRPKLKYIFCLTRKRSLMPTMSLMRYMNSVGLVPQLLINDVDFGEDQYLLITKELNDYNIKYNRINNLPDYNVIFSEGPGQCSFETHWLTESKKQGKTNVMLINSLSSYHNLPVPSFFPGGTKLLDGICMKIEDNVSHYREFTKDLFLINVGDSDWDWWKTNEFKEGVRKTKSKFGNKFLVLCESYIYQEKSIAYAKFCLKLSKELGFNIIINVHPDRWRYVPSQFRQYCNTNIHRHILFKASSHIISNIVSSVVAEGLFLGAKVGCSPFVAHYNGWGTHAWLDQNVWDVNAPKHVNQGILDMISLISNKKDLSDFLSSVSKTNSELAGKVLGRINVPCYAEYLFKTLDERLGK